MPRNIIAYPCASQHRDIHECREEIISHIPWLECPTRLATQLLEEVNITEMENTQT